MLLTSVVAVMLTLPVADEPPSGAPEPTTPEARSAAESSGTAADEETQPLPQPPLTPAPLPPSPEATAADDTSAPPAAAAARPRVRPAPRTVGVSTAPASARIVGEVIGGLLGTAAGGLGGFLIGALIGCAGGGGGYCALLGVMGTVPGMALGLSGGVQLGGWFRGGKAPYWATLLGMLAGGAAALPVLFLATALGQQSGVVASVAIGAAALLPLVGAVVGFEQGHHARTRAPSAAVVPLLLPGGGGLALAGSF